MDPGADEWVREFPETELKRIFGAPTYFRGRSYHESGHVRDLHVGDGYCRALVTGSGHQIYETEVERAGHRLISYCSCPIGRSCKHAVATLLAARATLTRPAGERSWEDDLAPLISRTDSGPATGRRLALEFAVPASPFGGTPRVTLQPLREGARAQWVKSGASWADVTQVWRSVDLNQPQRAVLAQIHQLTSDSGFGYGLAPTVDLADLGPLVWPLLQRAAALGVELLAGEGLRSVSLADGVAAVSLDLSQLPDGGILAQPRVSVVDPEAGGRLVLLGTPAHGIGHLDGGVLTLWPLAAPPTDGLDRMLTDGSAVAIPAEDAGRFLGLYYPALARVGTVTSTDGSVAPPDLRPPWLRLSVAHLPGHVAHLTWRVAYPSPLAGGDVTVLPLEPSRGDPPRDRQTELRLTARAAQLLESHPTLLGPGPQHALRPAAELRGIEVATLLAETLPAFRAAGVEVVEEGESAEYAEADEAPVIHFTTDDGTRRDWFDLHVTVTVDGQAVPFDQLFAALAAGDDALLLDSGTWFSLDIPELHDLRRLIEEARDLADSGRPDVLRLTPYQAGLWEELVGLGEVARQSQRWRDAVGRLLPDGDRDDTPVPAGLRATLRPYQERGFRWLAALWDAGLGGVLADDMGLGKTLQTLALLERARAQGDLDGRPALVVAPASVVGTWLDEAARFAPDLRTVAITATGKKRGTDVAAAVAGAHVVVTSYTLLRLEDAEYRALPWSGLVLDEAQFVKNHRSRTYQAARRLGASFTLAITGTPLENSLMDLWSMLSLSAPGLFPRPDHFVEHYRKPIEMERDRGALESLRRRIRPFVLRRTKRGVVEELPDKIEQVQRIELTPAHRRIYDKHLQRERQRVLGMLTDLDRNRVAIFRALTMLRQLALDPALVDGAREHDASHGPSAKVESLVEQVAELAAEGHRALVFSSFTGYLKLVRAALTEAGIGHVYLDGRTRDRPARIAEFREGDDPVFLISLKAGGFGLTLTEADYVFVLDPWWNPAAENQAIDRTHRIGQTRSVNVYRMVSVDTIEEKVVALQARKRDLFTSVVDSGSFSSGAITAADIRGLFDE